MHKQDFDQGFARSTEQGRLNAQLIPEVRGWCRHIEVKPRVAGLYAEMSGYPNSVALGCQYARYAVEAFRLEDSFENFLAENCKDCSYHLDGTNPGPASGRLVKIRERQAVQSAEDERKVDEAGKWFATTSLALKSHVGGQADAVDGTNQILALLEDWIASRCDRDSTIQLVEAATIRPLAFCSFAVELLQTASLSSPIQASALEVLCALAKRRPDVARTAAELAETLILTGQAVWAAARLIAAARLHGIEPCVAEGVARILTEQQDYTWPVGFPGDEEDEYSAANELLTLWCAKQPREARRYFEELLLSRDPLVRANACEIVAIVSSVDLQLALLPNALASLDLADSIGSEARTAAQRLAADTVTLAASQSIDMIDRLFGCSNSEAQVSLVEVLSHVLRGAGGPRREGPTDVDTARKAFQWCMNVLWRTDAHLEARAEAAQVIQEACEWVPEIAAEHAETLLGELVMVSDKDRPDRIQPVRVIVPSDPLPAVEAMPGGALFSDLHWRRLKGSIGAAVQNLAEAVPSLLMESVTRTYENLVVEEHPGAKAALTEVVGSLARADEWKAACIPLLWDALMRFESGAQIVRASALNALATGFSSRADLLPQDLTEMVCRALGDAFVIVHMAAVRCVRRLGLRRTRHGILAAEFLLNLLQVYKNRADSAYDYKEIAETLLRLTAGGGELEQLATASVLRSLPSAAAQVDWQILEILWAREVTSPSLALLVVRRSLTIVAKYPTSPYGGSASRLPGEFFTFVAAIQPQAFAEIVDELLEVARSVAATYPPFALRVAELLSRRGHPAQAADVLENVLRALPHGRKIAASGLLASCQAAVEHLNAALIGGQTGDTGTLLARLGSGLAQLKEKPGDALDGRLAMLEAIYTWRSLFSAPPDDAARLLQAASDLHDKLHRSVSESCDDEALAVNLAADHALLCLLAVARYASAAKRGTPGAELRALKEEFEAASYALRMAASKGTIPTTYLEGFLAVEDLLAGQGMPSLPALCDALCRVPIRPRYSEDAGEPSGRALPEDDRTGAPHVAAIRAELDGRNWTETLLLDRDRLYSLTIRGETAALSPDVQAITVHFSSRLPAHAFDLVLDDCALSRDKNTFEVSGTLRLSVTTGIMQEPAAFKLLALAQDTRGHKRALRNLDSDELKAHVVESISASSAVSAQLAEAIREKWAQLVPVAGAQLERELDSAVAALVTLGEFQLYSYERAVFTAAADEAQLQAEVRRFFDVKYPGELTEHAGVAGGVTDVVFRGLKIELKVERETSDRKGLASKYARQVGQYSAGSFRLLSAMVILDLTAKKAAPPADVRNDILLVNIPAHGTDGVPAYPSKAWVFLVAGNLEKPSSYSK